MTYWPSRQNSGRRTPQATQRRALLLELMEAQPGLTFRKLCEASSLAHGTVAYNLTVLARSKLYWTLRRGCLRLHFAGVKPASEWEHLDALRPTMREPERQILDYVESRGRAHQSAILDAVGGIRSTTQHRTERLVRFGLLRRMEAGRRVYYSIATPGVVMDGFGALQTTPGATA